MSATESWQMIQQRKVVYHNFAQYSGHAIVIKIRAVPNAHFNEKATASRDRDYAHLCGDVAMLQMQPAYANAMHRQGFRGTRRCQKRSSRLRNDDQDAIAPKSGHTNDRVRARVVMQ